MDNEKDFNGISVLQMDKRQTDNEKDETKVYEQSSNLTLSEKEGYEQMKNSFLRRHEKDPENLESVQRYAKRIKSFLGWEPYLEDQNNGEKSDESSQNKIDDENEKLENIGPPDVNESEFQVIKDDTEKVINIEAPEKCEQLEDEHIKNGTESDIDLSTGHTEIPDMSTKNDEVILDCEKNIQENEEIRNKTELKDVSERNDDPVYTKDDLIENDKKVCAEADHNSNETSHKIHPEDMVSDNENEIDNSFSSECQEASKENNSLPLENSNENNLKGKDEDHDSTFLPEPSSNEADDDNLNRNFKCNRTLNSEEDRQEVEGLEIPILIDSEQGEERRKSTIDENANPKGDVTENIPPINLRNEDINDLYEIVNKEIVFPKDEMVEKSPGNQVNILENENGIEKIDSQSEVMNVSVNNTEDIDNNSSQRNDKNEDDLKSEDSLDLDSDLPLNDIKKPYLKEVRRLSLGIVKDVIQSARNSVHELYSNKTDNEDLDEISKKLERLFNENKMQGSLSEDGQSISDTSFPKESKTEQSENSSLRNNHSFDGSILNKNDGLYQNNDNTKEAELIDKKISLEEENTECGYACFRPKCIQVCAKPKVFLALFSIIGVIHGCYYTYVVSVLSTLEKRYSFGSKISGTILLADEIVPLILGVFVGYLGGRMHRPRIVALGMFLSAACCFVSGFPYLIYGSENHFNFINYQNETGPQLCNSDKTDSSCESANFPETMTVFGLFLLASLLKGFATLSYYVLGISYIDDIIRKKNTPLYLATALALRLLGPLVGFLMSSGFLKIYENPFDDPGYGPDDPRWIGAWWIGFFLQGVLLIIFTLPIALFPRRLPGQKQMVNATSPATNDSLKDIFLGLLSALKRLGKNPVFIILIINTTMKIFGHFGHAIMLPKYMENQFRLSASEASLFSGATSIFCIMVSTVLGGFLIWKFRPRIKVLLPGMITSEIILCAGFLILMIPRCQNADMSHFGMNDEGLVLNSLCNQNCDCSTTSFTPFCGPDGKTTYFSPCYAGCTQDFTPTVSSKKNKEFGNCSCVVDAVQNQAGTTISEGFCPDENCWNQALVYLIILFCLVTVSNLFTVAHTMILLRSVHPNDKSVALGTFETFICLFGFIPFPVTFGALVDSACLVWEKSCGETGNCWFYDMDKFGYLLHGAAALFCFMSVLCLTTLYFLSSRVRNLYDEEEDEEKECTDIKLDTVSGSATKL